MKKFIGNVNGVEYTDREAFNEAVKKAMENQGEKLTITSYEKIVPDEEPKVKTKNILSNDDFVIELESDKVVSSNGDVEYNIPDGLEEKLKNCDNKEEVRSHIFLLMDEWSRCLSNINKNIEDCEKTIKEATATFEQQKEDKNKLIGGIKYYQKLLSFVEVLEESKKKEPTIKPKINKEPKINKDMFDEILEDFGSFLKRKGFFEM